MDPQQRRTAETFDTFRENYSEAVDGALAFTGLKTDFFTRVKADYIVELVDSHFGRRDIEALDVGCGVGNYHQLLSPVFARLSGVDVSSACIETARLRNPTVAYAAYDGGALPYPDASFDLAFTICVLHHVPPAAWPGFLSEMRRVLKPGGMALIFEHNPRNRLTMRVVNKCAFDEDAVLLRMEETEALMTQAGFASVEGRFILSVPAKGAALRRIDQMFGRLPFGAQYFVKALP